MRFMHVVSFTLLCMSSVRHALAHLRQLCACADSPQYPVLLFCDLPDADCPKPPDEDSLIQALRAGIKSMHAKQADSCFLLVRRRVWDDAARQYLGSSQNLSCREVIAQLILCGESSASFEYASIAPASMKGRWEAVLFSDISLVCTPDTPMRMAAYLQSQSLSTVGARVFLCSRPSCSALNRICALAPFSLSPMRAAQEYAWARQEQISSRQPILYTLEALSRITEIQAVSAAPQCRFILRQTPDLPSFFLDYRRLCHANPLCAAGIPLLQLLLLAAAAALGMPVLAACALLPELWALLHLRTWPGMLLRTALLPLTALHAFDVLLCRLLARSPLFRLRIPVRLLSPFTCLFAALALLSSAMISVYALTAVLPFVMLWLGIAFLYSALDQPGDGAAAPNPT